MSRNFDVLIREMPQVKTKPAPHARKAEAIASRDPIAVIDSEIARLVQQVFLAHDGNRPTTAVTFCGVKQGDGCSWVSARASEALSDCVAGRVCIVDADFRFPSLHEHFRMENGAGLAEAIKNSTPIESFVRAAWNRHLWFVSAGTIGCDASGVPNAGRLGARLSELRAAFDYVLIDAPPFSSCGDGALLGQMTDGVVLVVGCNSTRRETARAAKRELETAGAPILGTVLNKRTYPIPEALYRRL